MKLLFIIFISIYSLPVICQSEANEDMIQSYIYCLDAYVRATPQDFDLPIEGRDFLVKKLVVTLYLKKGELVAFNQNGIEFESKIGENTIMAFLKAPCIDMFEKIKKGKVRRGQKVVRVYEYFLAAPRKYFSPQNEQILVKEFYNQEVENELKKLKKGGKILDISYKFISAGCPIF
ncbi:hypothetical protein QWY85_04430 [Neolewinella lacunae]|uniref:Uncharacterized protein n=1 Tax=Neolewinella lacunae TaxID=1517758 RepID=A0A923PMA6_9BACT|nr:hypothetical protein [Neolewinella lacunae]MBC6996773.1 hypothetical protein [Neolewinella lacunae]MDN3633893.1 hypothetical protein [Neolewinella lacunae]